MTTRNLHLAGLAAVSLWACEAAKIDITIPVTQPLTFALDMDQTLGQTAGQTAQQDLAQDVTTAGQNVDLIKTEPKLQQYKSKVKSIKVTGVTATPTSNTLSGNLPALEVYVGSPGFTKLDDGAKLAAVPVIPPASTAAVTATVDAASADKASKFLTTLQFDAKTLTKLVVKKGEKVPGGKVALKLDVKFEVVVTPL